VCATFWKWQSISKWFFVCILCTEECVRLTLDCCSPQHYRTIFSGAVLLLNHIYSYNYNSIPFFLIFNYMLLILFPLKWNCSTYVCSNRVASSPAKNFQYWSMTCFLRLSGRSWCYSSLKCKIFPMHNILDESSIRSFKTICVLIFSLVTISVNYFSSSIYPTISQRFRENCSSVFVPG
jgi:hypothetical protein